MSSEDIKKIGVRSMGQRNFIYEEIIKLEKKRFLDTKDQSIYLKFKNLDLSSIRHIRIGNWVESLCSSDLIKKTYLSENSDFLECTLFF